MSDSDCCICMETLQTNNLAVTSCGHKFCLECLLKHYKSKNNCPLCRQELVKNEPQRSATVSVSEPHYELDIPEDEMEYYEMYNQLLEDAMYSRIRRREERNSLNVEIYESDGLELLQRRREERELQEQQRRTEEIERQLQHHQQQQQRRREERERQQNHNANSGNPLRYIMGMITPVRRNIRRCGLCRQEGHDRRTCPTRNGIQHRVVIR